MQVAFFIFMKTISLRIKVIVRLVGGLFLFFFLQRLVFFLFNFSFFKTNSIGEILQAFLWGSRFDLWIIFAFNGLLIILLLLPLRNVSFRKFFLFYFVIVNALISLFNLIDVEYFSFTLKRSTADLFLLVGTGQDVWILLPQFIVDFWYLILIWILLIIVLWYFGRRIWLDVNQGLVYSVRTVFYHFLIFISISIIAFIILRGTRLRPVNLLSASLHAKSNLVPLVLNTPFSIVKTIGKSKYQIHKYFDNPKDLVYSPDYTLKSSFKLSTNKKNVVILILESFSKEHIGFFNPSTKYSYTPFLDSLLKHSLVVRYSFANGRKSIESLPSILASIPSLMETPYILSTFSQNQIEALPAIMKKNGYTTSFYHGGTNGTMGFDVFSAMAGIENYFGRWQYPNSDDYDGNWGIWDEPYLQYVKKQLDRTKNPFFAVIYTLSSHHPYLIPKKYENMFPEGEHEILKSIAYADYSLKRFFDEAKQANWFKNTLFVITADHVFGSHSDFYYNKIGSYSVPIAFYCETDTLLKGVLPIIAQHTDIAPSILDYLGIDVSMVAFGSSIWDTSSNRFAINYINGSYLFYQDDYLVEFDGKEVLGYYQFKTDSLMKHNLKDSILPDKEKHIKFVKSFIQQYDEAIVNNKLKRN